jgi:dynein intermediate chain, cytosolic
MADAARTQRQAALEEKKKRLEELKARRNERKTPNVSSDEAARTRIAASSNLDDYIEGLLQVPAAAAAAGPSSVPVTRQHHDAAAAAALAAKSASGAPPENGFQRDGVAGDGEDSAEGEAHYAPALAAPSTVSMTSTRAEMFEMGTQTAHGEFPMADEDDDEEEEAREDAAEKKGEDTTNQAEAANQAAAERLEAAKVLTAEEVERELSSEAFSSFLNATSKKVERVLGSDLLADLLLDYDGETDGSKRVASKSSDGSKYLSSRQIYECPKWTASRDVTDMDWSPLHRELMLCGYHMPSSSSSLGQPVGSSAVKVISPVDTPSDSLAPRSGELLSDGLALVWNLAMPGRPEHIFTCGSPVTACRFHATEAPLIVGGCQSGQVVVWDVRAGRMPVQKSSLTTTSSGNSKGHTHPICSMEVIEGGVSASI